MQNIGGKIAILWDASSKSQNDEYYWGRKIYVVLGVVGVEVSLAVPKKTHTTGGEKKSV